MTLVIINYFHYHYGGLVPTLNKIKLIPVYNHVTHCKSVKYKIIEMLTYIICFCSIILNRMF